MQRSNNDAMVEGTAVLTCRDASRLSSEAQDRGLTLTERWGLTLHLAMCSLCRRYARQLAFLRLAAGSLASRVDAERGLSDDARTRIRRNLRRDLER